MSGEPEEILPPTQTVDTAQIPIESQPPASPEDDAADSKGAAPAGSEPQDNSRILQLASIAKYRTTRRTAMAERTRRCEQLEPAFPARKS
jgi:hypothetical protein